MNFNNFHASQYRDAVYKNPDSLIRFRVDAVFEQLVYCNFEKEDELWSYTSGSMRTVDCTYRIRPNKRTCSNNRTFFFFFC